MQPSIENDMLKSPSVIDISLASQNIEDRISRISSSVSNLTILTHSDSGLSSIDSTLLFLAELRECFKQQNENNNLTVSNDNQIKGDNLLKLTKNFDYKNKLK